MANIGLILKSTKNADHPWKRFQKRINLSKVMAKTSHGQKLWPFPLYFEPILGRKYGFQRQHFPCEFRADLYVFGTRRTRRMGAACKLIQNQTFWIFAPPPNVDAKKPNWALTWVWHNFSHSLLFETEIFFKPLHPPTPPTPPGFGKRSTHFWYVIVIWLGETFSKKVFSRY